MTEGVVAVGMDATREKGAAESEEETGRRGVRGNGVLLCKANNCCDRKHVRRSSRCCPVLSEHPLRESVSSFCQTASRGRYQEYPWIQRKRQACQEQKAGGTQQRRREWQSMPTTSARFRQTDGQADENHLQTGLTGSNQGAVCRALGLYSIANRIVRLP